MPNWCENQFSITGKKEDVMDILKVMCRQIGDNGNIVGEIEDIKIEDLDALEIHILHNLYPTPEDLLIGDAPFSKNTPEQLANKEKHGYTDWYDWRIDHWGCKWAESDLRITEYPIVENDIWTIGFRFESPWAPPIDGLSHIAADWPKILFCLYYEEPGMGFCGSNIWANGEMERSEEAELVSDYFDENYLYNEYMSK